MPNSQLPEASAGSRAATRSSRWARVLRLLVPIPKGTGARAKTGWVCRRIVYWYFLILVMLAAFQRYLIYEPSRAETIDPEFYGLGRNRVEDVVVAADDGIALHGWLVRAFPPDAFPKLNGSPRQAVIYFPGNAGHRGYRTSELDLLSRAGADVYLVDYRGYGENAGRPTEELLANDARAVWNAVISRRGAKPSDVVILGESLGGGVATRLAADLSEAGTRPGGLILRSTFTSLADVGAYHYWWLPVRMLLIDQYASAQRIAKVACPLLIIHGTADTIVPYSLGRRLFDAAAATSASGVAKRFTELRGAGHNDVLYAARDEYRNSVQSFLRGLAPAPPVAAAAK